MAYEYTTAAKIQEELRLSTAFGTTTLPTLNAVTSWIEEDSNHINDIGGRNYGDTQYTEYIDYDGSERIQLEHAPIISVNSLLYSSAGALGTSAYALDDTQVEDTDFVVYTDRGEIKPLFQVWSPKEGDRRIYIDYNAGYAITPFTVQKLATKMVDSAIQNDITEKATGKSVSVGSISIVKAADVGVGQYKEIQMDIQSLKSELVKGTGILRYTNY